MELIFFFGLFMPETPPRVRIAIGFLIRTKCIKGIVANIKKAKIRIVTPTIYLSHDALSAVPPTHIKKHEAASMMIAKAQERHAKPQTFHLE